MSTNGSSSQQRQTLRASLMRRWIEVQRPDVVKAIEAEVDSQYPRAPRAKKQASLPKSLAVLK